MVIPRLGVSTDMAWFGSRFHSRFLVGVAALGGLTLGACSQQKAPPFVIAVAGSSSNEVCSTDTRQLSQLSPKLVRLTVRKRASATDKGSFYCDKVIKFPDEQPVLQLKVDTSNIDLWAEAFGTLNPADPKAGSVSRIATGVLANIPNTNTTGSVVRMLPSAEFSCAAGGLNQARAFHSATSLPNGQVLVVGGAVAGADPAATNLDQFALFATGSIEYYDPTDLKFHAVMDAAPNARAFHQAVLMNAAPPYQILVVGGLNNTTAGEPLLELSTDPGEGTRFFPRSNPFTLFHTKAVAAELLTYDPDAKTVTHTPMTSIPTAALQALGLSGTNVVVAGGIDFTQNPNSPIDNTHAENLVNTVPLATGMLASDTAGAALAFLNSTTAVLYGGARNDTPVGGELLTLLGTGMPMATAFPSGASTLKAVRFPTLSVLSPTTLLTTGGFEVLSGGGATQPVASAVAAQIITVNGTTVTVAPASLGSPADCGSATRYRAAGWEGATALPGGRALITGGAPSTTECGGNCESGQTANFALTCALHQSAIFDNGVLSLGNPMGIARAGHVLSPLSDGSYLVTGGLQSTTSVARLMKEVELYNPRRVVPPWDTTKPALGDADDPINDELLAASESRAPGDVAKHADGTPVSPCPDL